MPSGKTAKRLLIVTIIIVNYSNTAVMHAQKLEIHQQKPFMNRKIVRQ